MAVGEQAPSYPLAAGRETAWPDRLRLRVSAAANDALQRHGVVAAVALASFGLAFNGGSFGLIVRSQIAIVVWWGLALTVGLSLLPRERPPRAALYAGGLLAAYALLAAASMGWGDSAETAFNEFNRGALYLGLFVLAVAAGTRREAGKWATGLAIGMAGVVVVALAARLFPELVDAESHAALFRDDPRAVYPLGYWNGLAVFAALAVPLLLRLALTTLRAPARALALATLPAVAGLIYLTASRGGAVVALLAAALFVAVTSDRARAGLAALVGAAGAAGAVAVLSARPTIVNGPLDSSAAASQGRSAALLIGLICVLTGVAWVLASRLSIPRPRVPRRLKWALTGLAAALAIAAVVAADPAARLEAFKDPPPPFEVGSSFSGSSDSGAASYTSSHFTSDGGSGRWQFWDAALREFRDEPILGGGAGSFGAWWAEHGTLQDATRDAHSLYLEALGELGLVGFALLLALLIVAAVAAGTRLRGSAGDERATVAALTAVGGGLALAAGIDWMWELPAVFGVGVVCLGLLLGPATTARRRGPRPAGPARRRMASRWAFVLLAAALIVGQAIPLLAQADIRNSRAAASREEYPGALERARAARGWQPWASSPHLQVALIEEQRGRYAEARTSILRAIDRDPGDWRLWLAASRIEAEAGFPRAASRKRGRAQALNPRSPLFARAR